ncbi:MAG TPA: sulfur carrier protein ThiS [Chloroflexota bacterium]|jgi:sulfur carrier protein
MLSLTVNGKPREIAEPMTLLAFLQAHNVNPQLIAVEYNGDIIRRERYAGVMLQAGDKLEIVHMVGGGAR